MVANNNSSLHPLSSSTLLLPYPSNLLQIITPFGKNNFSLFSLPKTYLAMWMAPSNALLPLLGPMLKPLKILLSSLGNVRIIMYFLPFWACCGLCHFLHSLYRNNNCIVGICQNEQVPFTWVRRTNGKKENKRKEKKK